MNTIDSFIENAINWRNHRHCEISQAEEDQAKNMHKFKEDLNILADETKKSQKTIERNLNSIMSHKHSIHKTEVSANEMRLPITNTYHGEFFKFISNSMSLINEFGENGQHNPEKILDASEVSENVKICNENIMKLIHKENNAVDEVQTIMENIQTVKEYCKPSLEEELPLSDSSFLDEM